MSKRKSTVSQAQADQLIAQIEAGPVATINDPLNLLPQATIVVAAPRTKESMRGRSLVQGPVALVWAICHNAYAVARTNGAEAPSRKALFDLCVDAQIAKYTARTQIQAYLKASGNGTVVPAKHPKNVSFNA